jgi:ubiquinone/menaquinone biosynthesis C-methylase UbiE
MTMNCNRIARWYRWLEYLGFGRALEQRREAFLSHAAGARHVLALGEGDGRSLAALRRVAPGAHTDYVDVSARMLTLARGRAGTDSITYHCGDALTLPLIESEYDVIVTHFFLDCFEEADLELLAARIERAAAPGARWIVSEFRKSGWLVQCLYAFFQLTTGLRTRRLVDHHPVLLSHGFRLKQNERAWRGLLASELWVRGA